MLCWGNASFGQLGLGGIDEEIVIEPRRCDFFQYKNFRDVGCGCRHTVFVLDDGTVYTCGCNDLGQLGHDKGRKKPEQVGALDAQNIISVSCGEAHTLALNDKGQVFSWGLATDGQLGLPGVDEYTRVPRNIKSLSEIQIVQVACGHHHSLALSKASDVYAWGQNRYGQLGLGYELKKESAPRQIKSLSGIPFSQIAAGGAHSFALTLSGAVFGWGRNKFGQLGLNDETDRYVPTLLKSLRSQKIIYISCGEDHTAAQTKEGGVFTFGAGGYGQLGHNSTSNEVNPRKVFELMGSFVAQIACGRGVVTAWSGFYSLTTSSGVGSQPCDYYTSGHVFAILEGLRHPSVKSAIPPRTNIKLKQWLFKCDCVLGTELWQHTLAFVPSTGRMFSFGLGGNGQLGTGSTCNRKSPFTVKGNWLPNNDYAQHTENADGCYCVKKIFSGGDQSFAHYFNTQNCFPPDDSTNCNRYKEIWTVNDELIQRWLNLSSERLPLEIANEIDKVFSSAACLNGSFLSFSNNDHYRTSSKFSGIDMNLARLMFHRLINSGPSQIYQQVAASLEKNLIPKLTSSPPDIEALRLYLTLPECPLMTDVNNFSSLAIPFGTAIVNLEKAPLKVLENWWSLLEHPLFLKVVQLFKDVVVYLLKLTKIGIPPMERRIFNNFLNTALKVLEILHRVNEKAGQIICYDKFYIHEVQDFIDIRNDYINWVQHQAFGMDINHGLSEATDLPDTICTYPFVFDAQAKTTLLQTDAVLQMQMAVDQAHRQNFSSIFLPVFESVDPCLILIVRRDNIVGDTMEVLRKTKNIDYKKPLKVIFVGEEAVDAGGVRKEFFLLIMRELLDPKYGMFRFYEDSRLIWFADQTFEDINLFHLIGVICGLAIYNFTIVDLHFPLALYKKLLKKKPILDDVKELMPDVGRSMQQLLDYAEDDIEETFYLNFTITVENFGTTEVRELIPNGTDTPVNKKNKHEFVNAYVDYIFNISVASLFDAFCTGFHKVCGGKVLELFQPNELQAMVIGNTNYDWKELEITTEYKGEYWAGHPTIKMFWDVFHQLPLDEKKQFLLFLTGSDRIPILGMKSLKLVIQPTGASEDFLPVAHTCFNLLDLPKYTDKETLKCKLIQAIDHYEGFNLV